MRLAIITVLLFACSLALSSDHTPPPQLTLSSENVPALYTFAESSNNDPNTTYRVDVICTEGAPIILGQSLSTNGDFEMYGPGNGVRCPVEAGPALTGPVFLVAGKLRLTDLNFGPNPGGPTIDIGPSGEVHVQDTNYDGTGAFPIFNNQGGRFDVSHSIFNPGCTQTAPTTQNAPTTEGAATWTIAQANNGQGRIVTSAVCAKGGCPNQALDIRNGYLALFDSHSGRPINCAGNCDLYGSTFDEDLCAPILLLTKEYTDDPVLQGYLANLRYTIKNLSPIWDATDIQFDEKLNFPHDLTRPVGEGPYPCGEGSKLKLNLFSTSKSPSLSLAFSGGSLSAGKTCSFDVTVEVLFTAPVGRFDGSTKHFSATINGERTFFADAKDELVINPVLLITKEFTDDPVVPGGTVKLRFTLTNQSEIEDATAIKFPDVLPDVQPLLPELTVVPGFLNTGSCDGEIQAIAGGLQYKGGSLPPTTSCAFSVDVLVPNTTSPGSYENVIPFGESIFSGNKVSMNLARDILVVSPPPSVKAFGKPTALANTPITNSGSVGAGTMASDVSPGSSLESVCNDFGPNAFASLGFNIATDGSCSLNQPNDLPNTDPMVAVDANSIPQPRAGSPVIESGPVDFVNNQLPCLYKDLNGLGRPQDFDLDGVFTCDRGPVEIQGGPDIGAAQTAAFFALNRNGEGAFVEVLANGLAIISFYTYSLDGTQLAWYMGLGRVVGNSVVVDKMQKVTGGVFGAGFDEAKIVRTDVGGMSLIFPDCSATTNPGRLNFTARSDSGLENLLQSADRLTSVIDCDGTKAANAQRSGAFFALGRSGEGIFVQWLSNGQVVLVFYTFDTNGNPFWVISDATNTVVNGNTITANMLYAQGKTKFGLNFNPAEVALAPWGTVTLVYNDDDNIAFAYNSTLAGFGAGNHAYVRLTQPLGTKAVAQGD